MSRLRIDRAVTLGLTQPAQRIFKASPVSRIQVLMYHGIRSVTGASHPYFETNTSPNVFMRHMNYLHEGGYKPIDLNTAARLINSGTYPQKSVVITFDDGFRDFYTHALPILREFQFPATMFIISDFMRSQPASFEDREFMSWAELREIESLGIAIGSHTVSHPRLHSLPWKDIERELKVSKQTIEDKLGRLVSLFSHPYAFPEQDGTFLKQLRRYMEAAGYDYGVTTVVGSLSCHSDRYFLPRLPSNEYDDDGLFQAKLEGSYDWLHAPQLIYKFIRNHKYKRAQEFFPKDLDKKHKLATEL